MHVWYPHAIWCFRESRYNSPDVTLHIWKISVWNKITNSDYTKEKSQTISSKSKLNFPSAVWAFMKNSSWVYANVKDDEKRKIFRKRHEYLCSMLLLYERLQNHGAWRTWTFRLIYSKRTLLVALKKSKRTKFDFLEAKLTLSCSHHHYFISLRTTGKSKMKAICYFATKSFSHYSCISSPFLAIVNFISLLFRIESWTCPWHPKFSS